MDAGVVVSAGLLAWAPLPPAGIERWYAQSLYPHLQQAITSVTNALPFAFLDILLILTVLIAGVCLVRAWRRSRRTRSIRPLAGYVWALLTAAAALYLVFLAIWGLNYRRIPMVQRLELSRPAPDSEAVTELAMVAARRLNELYSSAHDRGWSGAEWRDPSLRTAFTATSRMLTDAEPATPGRLKRSLLGPYFRWSSVDGMVNPFGLEVLANPDLLPWERPFVAAHEWAHLAGYANEAEANFVGWLTCIRADVAAQYSGWLFLYWQVASEVRAADRAAIANVLESGPRRDINAIVERLRRGQFPLLQKLSWQVYDGYLKANRVEEGVRSYGEVITLILRARFDDGWVPVRRDRMNVR